MESENRAMLFLTIDTESLERYTNLDPIWRSSIQNENQQNCISILNTLQSELDYAEVSNTT